MLTSGAARRGRPLKGFKRRQNTERVISEGNVAFLVDIIQCCHKDGLQPSPECTYTNSHSR